MKKIILFILLGAVCLTAFAQDDLLSQLEKEDSAIVKQDITAATFKATRVINMQSVEMTGAGNLQFMITHHFGNLWSKGEGTQNLANFFGLNSGVANTLMSFDYSPKYWANIGVVFAGRGNYQGWTKFKLVRQQSGKKNVPVTVVWFSTVNWDANKSTDKAYTSTAWNRFSYLHQLLVARKFSEKFSLQVYPSWVHYNVVAYGPENSNNVFSAGVGGRYKLTHKTAITFEYSRQFNMYENVLNRNGQFVNYNPNVFAVGYDWDTGGHIFQFFVSSTNFASNISQLSINPYENKGVSLGFNLNRSYAIKKAVKPQ